MSELKIHKLSLFLITQDAFDPISLYFEEQHTTKIWAKLSSDCKLLECLLWDNCRKRERTQLVCPYFWQQTAVNWSDQVIVDA